VTFFAKAVDFNIIRFGLHLIVFSFFKSPLAFNGALSAYIILNIATVAI
jgi:hypothetical protein